MRTLEKNLSARPPVVVSGLPRHDADLLAQLVDEDARGVGLRERAGQLAQACDIRRACRPTVVSPISPSISARGTSAATESMTMQSIAPDRTSMSQISSACSPVSGWEMSTSSMSTPRRAA